MNLVARLEPDGELIVVDTDAPHRREHVATAPPAFSRRVIRRWATFTLERAGWWAHGDWWIEDDANMRRVTPSDRVITGGRE